MSQSVTVQFELPAKYACLHSLHAHVQALLDQVDDLPTPEATIYNIRLALHEICNNIIDHAYGHENGQIKIVLTVDHESDRFRADLYDNGQPFEPTSIRMPNLDEPQEAGYGLFLAHELMDDVIYERCSSSNHWCLVKTW